MQMSWLEFIFGKQQRETRSIEALLADAGIMRDLDDGEDTDVAQTLAQVDEDDTVLLRTDSYEAAAEYASYTLLLELCFKPTRARDGLIANLATMLKDDAGITVASEEVPEVGDVEQDMELRQAAHEEAEKKGYEIALEEARKITARIDAAIERQISQGRGR